MVGTLVSRRGAHFLLGLLYDVGFIPVKGFRLLKRRVASARTTYRQTFSPLAASVARVDMIFLRLLTRPDGGGVEGGGERLWFRLEKAVLEGGGLCGGVGGSSSFRRFGEGAGKDAPLSFEHSLVALERGGLLAKISSSIESADIVV